RAQLDFTYAVGKTGTSSSYRDAWFMGFTGDYVTGVWIGNDDYRPMDRVTGGGLPATTWHNIMVAIHHNMNIRQIPGLPLHPVQVAERKRLEELRRTQPLLAQQLAAGRNGKLMPDQLKSTLTDLARRMRLTAGLPEPAPTSGTNDKPGRPGQPPGGDRPPADRPQSPPRQSQSNSGRKAWLQTGHSPPIARQ
ncbi:MAG: penicillin-binding protein, partial [Hyphomicrobiaceae bacterium]